MIDKQQADHFDNADHRYKERLILYPPKHTTEEVNLIISEIKKRNIHTVVDFGSGNGRLTIPLLLSGIDVTAVDISRNSLLSLTNLIKQVHVPKGRLTIRETLPRQRGKKRAIVGCDILHHIDLKIYLPLIKDNLEKKGLIVFSEPNILNFAWAILITFFIDWRIEWRILYNNYFTLTKKLNSYGFKNVKLKGVGLFPPPLFNVAPVLQKLNYYLGDLFFLKLFAYRYIIIAEKG